MITDWIVIVVIIIILAVSVLLYTRRLGRSKVNERFEKETIDTLTAYIRETFNELLKVNLYEMNLRKDEFEKRMYNKNSLRKALKNCTYGDLNAKNYIKEYIRDLLLNQYGIKEEHMNDFIHFNKRRQLSVQDQFEILLYVYKKTYDLDALSKLIEDYDLDKGRADTSGTLYEIDHNQITRIFDDMYPFSLNLADKIAILTQRIYQNYKGYGVVDEIRDMKIDGVSGGVSGIPPDFANLASFTMTEEHEKLPFNYDAVWLFYKGKTIHLKFLSFGSERELIRICKNIYRFNKPGQLSESNGYKINEMKDGSRVVVARPPFCESWVFFVRKFDSVKKAELQELITDKGSAYPIELIRWLIKGCRVTAITGSQGTGKTTLLMAIIRYINPAFTLRIQETAFELNLRKTYPNRNIVTFRETATISGQEGLDLQKKTDGTVNILGEVATASVSALMIQMAQVASLFTLFTHHAKTARHLIGSLRNNLLQTGVFRNEKIAEQQVADVINFDIHLEKDVEGHRYIERITEIIPIKTNEPYCVDYRDSSSQEERMNHFMDTMTEYFYRVTDRRMYETRDLIRYVDGAYEWCGSMSEHSKASICQMLNEPQREAFLAFINQEGLWKAIS